MCDTVEHGTSLGMLNHESRRQVQRRFPPGTFIIDDELIYAFVVGWAPVAADVDPKTGTIKRIASWEVLLLRDNRLIRMSWLALSAETNLDEWEEQATQP